MKRHMGDYLKAIGIRSGEFLDVAKIKLDILSLKKQKDDELRSIGAIVFKMCSKDKFDEKKVSGGCKTVARLNEEIKAKEKEIQKIHEGAEKMISKNRGKGSKNRAYEEHTRDLVEAEYYSSESLE